MKITHVVSTFSDDGTSGGVIRVALEQCKGLKQRGHDVRLIAGWRGDGTPPTSVEGIPTQMAPVRPPPLVGERAQFGTAMPQVIRSGLAGADVAHIHLCRDVITTTAALMARRRRLPYVTQTHGMITPSTTWGRRALDPLVRPALAHAATEICLTLGEMADLQGASGHQRQTLLPNAMTPLPVERREEAGLIIFLGRLVERKHPDWVVDAAEELAGRSLGLRWVLIGPDEGMAGVLSTRMRNRPELPIRCLGALARAEAMSWLARAAIYVLPSENEPFPMTLVEALSLGVPSICTTGCGLAAQLRDSGAAEVIEPSSAALTSAIESLLADSGRRESLRRNALEFVERELSLRALSEQLEFVYDAAVKMRSGGRPAA